MKKTLSITLMVSIALLASQAIAQDGGTTSGPVWRITYLKVKPGKGADHAKWLREYRSRILAEQKSAGLILDYKFFTKPTFDNSPGDWDIADAVMYRNYAEALDPNEDRGKKVVEIGNKVFGSMENRNKVWAELRDPSREVVASHLVRELTFNPVK